VANKYLVLLLKEGNSALGFFWLSSVEVPQQKSLRLGILSSFINVINIGFSTV